MFGSCNIGIIFIGVLASVAVGEQSACQNRSLYDYDYGSDSCIFFIDEIASPTGELNQVDAKQACKTNQGSYSADLPIIDTLEKADELNAILDGTEPDAPYYLAFWIRLQREVPYSHSEAEHLGEWENPEKWSWGPGQSTLKNWNAWVEGYYQQPDNHEYRSKNNLSLDLAKSTELCVMAVRSPEKKIDWYDMLCESVLDDGKEEDWRSKRKIRFMLACQWTKKQDTSLPETSVATPSTSSTNPSTSSIATSSTSSMATPLTSSIAMPPTSSTGKPLPSPGSRLPPTTTSTDMPSPTTTSVLNPEQKNPNSGDPPTTKAPFPWPWLMGGLAVALVLVCVALVIIAVFVRRRRRRRAEPKAKHHHHRHHRHHRTETDVSSSPSWRHPRERDEHRRHVEDEISRRQHRSGRFSRRRSDKKPTEVTTKSGRLPRRRSDKESTETKRRSGRRDRDN